MAGYLPWKVPLLHQSMPQVFQLHHSCHSSILSFFKSKFFGTKYWIYIYIYYTLFDVAFLSCLLFLTFCYHYKLQSHSPWLAQVGKHDKTEKDVLVEWMFTDAAVYWIVGVLNLFGGQNRNVDFRCNSLELSEACVKKIVCIE